MRERSLGDAFAFFDAGRTWVIDSLACEPTGTGIHLRSVGGGFDLLPGQKVTGSLTFAHALDSATILSSTASSGCPASGPATAAGQSRVLFQLRGTF
jgi:hypothetical protein